MRMIDNDRAVSRNFQRLTSQAIEDVFDPEDSSLTLAQFKEAVVGDISKKFSDLFPELKLDSLGNPLEDGTFRFTKGNSSGFSFKNLSGGEKAVFDLILDLVVAKRAYDNTVYCIDEPEAHMNPRLQAKLLSTLYDIVPENCQLVLATHSIGMMRRARDIEVAAPGNVVFLDFGDRDFDKPQIIEPISPDRTFWMNAYNVALDDLATLIVPKQIVICEGEPKNSNTTKNYSHDAQCYERIFEAEFPETQFLPGGSPKEIIEDRRGLAFAFSHLTRGVQIIKLVDRDDLSPEEIAGLNQKSVRVLSKRNLESYFFDDEVLVKLSKSFGKEDKISELLDKKKDILGDSSGRPKDDLKPVSGNIYDACKDVLDLTGCGGDSKAFMRDTLAPLITVGMNVYEGLKHDIFEVTNQKTRPF